MANIADCEVLIDITNTKEALAKLEPVVSIATASNTEDSEKEFVNVFSLDLVLNYEELNHYFEAHRLPPLNIYSTRDLRFLKKGDKYLIAWQFDGRWGFPDNVLHWLDSLGLPYQYGAVEDGCGVENLDGEDLGLVLYHRNICPKCGYIWDTDTTDDKPCPQCYHKEHDTETILDHDDDLEYINIFSGQKLL